MPRASKRHKTPTSSSAKNKDKENVAKQLVLDKCCLELYEATRQNGGRKRYGCKYGQ